MAGTVVRISIAPVKSLHLVHPEEIELTRTGVVGDRRFWLLDADGRLANAKRFPQLLQPVETTLYGTPHPSRRVGGPWEEAISELAGEPITLLWSERGAVDRGS